MEDDFLLVGSIDKSERKEVSIIIIFPYPFILFIEDEINSLSKFYLTQISANFLGLEILDFRLKVDCNFPVKMLIT